MSTWRKNSEVVDTVEVYRKVVQTLKDAEPRPSDRVRDVKLSACVPSVDLQLAPNFNLGQCPETEQEASRPLVFPLQNLSNSNVGSLDAKVGLSLASEGLEFLDCFPANFPQEKRIPGTQFVVDGFRFAGQWSVAYFLSHFHSDHYTGLTSLWDKGLVFCSEITALLVVESLKVLPALVIPLPLGTAVRIDGSEVILVDANHCPGAVQFLFRVPAEATKFHRYVHTGDMRYSPTMKEDSSLCEFVGADAVFLDTTYCNPKFVFPPQRESVEYVAETVFRLMGEDGKLMPEDLQGIRDFEGGSTRQEDLESSDISVENLKEPKPLQMSVDSVQNVEFQRSRWPLLANGPENSHKSPGNEAKGLVSYPIHSGSSLLDGQEGKSTLFLISTYVIGKEKILFAVAERCNSLIYVTEKKLALLRCLKLDDCKVFTTDPSATSVHVVKWSFFGETWPYFRPNFVNMEKVMQERGCRKVVGFVPTGWTYELKKKTFSVRKKGPCEIHLVPYSEHSNYEELRDYVGFLRPLKIIPTVGLEGGGMDGKAVASMRRHFRNLVDETASKRNFLNGFSRKAPGASTTSTHVNSVSCLEGAKHDAAEAEGLSEEEVPVGTGTIYDVLLPVLLPSNEELATVILPSASPDAMLLAGASYVLETASIPEENIAQQGIEVVPRAVFGRGARRRKRINEGNVVEDNGVTLDCQFPLPMASSVTVSKTQSELFTESGMLAMGNRCRVPSERPVSVSNVCEALLHENSVHSGEEGIKALQIDCNSGKLEDDRFGRPEVKLMEKIAGRQHSASSAKFQHQESALNSTMDSHAIPLFEAGAHVTLSQPSTLQSSQVNVSSRSKGIKRKISPKIGAKRNTPSKKGKKTNSVPFPFKKEQSQESRYVLSTTQSCSSQDFNQAVKREKATQSSILSFFRKSAQDSTSERKQVSSHRQVARDSTICSLVQRGEDRPAAREELVHQTNCSRQSWEEEIDQLSTILEGNTSEELVKSLLEQANGDVGIALDLFYAAQSEGKDVHGLLPNNSPPLISRIEPSVHMALEGDNEPIKGRSYRRCPDVDMHRLSLGIIGNDVEEIALCAEEAVACLSVKAEHIRILREKTGTHLNSVSVALPIADYEPIGHACWRSGEPAPYLHLARAFDLIEQESGRLKTENMLCNMFRSLLALSTEAVLPALYLTTNRLGPVFQGVDLNVGGSLVSAAISEVAGVSKSRLKDLYNSLGDLGRFHVSRGRLARRNRWTPLLKTCILQEHKKAH